MDGATLHNRIYAGRAKAAQRIGLPCRVYRPITYAEPLTNQVAILNAAFNVSDSRYRKSISHGNPTWYVDIDGRVTQPGDYLVRISDGATWFIASQEQILPIVAVDCQRGVRIQRAAVTANCGVSGYSSAAINDDVLGTVDSLWPASISLGGRVQPSEGLPAGVKQGGWKILLPPSVPIVINHSDIIIDDLGRRYAVESAESSNLGWRLIANEVHT